jgi:hypothetical protein
VNCYAIWRMLIFVSMRDTDTQITRVVQQLLITERLRYAISVVCQAVAALRNSNWEAPLGGQTFFWGARDLSAIAAEGFEGVGSWERAKPPLQPTRGSWGASCATPAGSGVKPQPPKHFSDVICKSVRWKCNQIGSLNGIKHTTFSVLWTYRGSFSSAAIPGQEIPWYLYHGNLGRYICTIENRSKMYRSI